VCHDSKNSKFNYFILVLCYDIITMLIFSPFISATSPPEINGISTYNNKNQFKYIQSYRCPSFKRILSSTTSNVIKCCRRCGQILNCYAVSYSEIASRCQLFTNQALSSTTFNDCMYLKWFLLLYVEIPLISGGDVAEIKGENINIVIMS
jgi:hypothetical protein